MRQRVVVRGVTFPNVIGMKRGCVPKKILGALLLEMVHSGAFFFTNLGFRVLRINTNSAFTLVTCCSTSSATSCSTCC